MVLDANAELPLPRRKTGEPGSRGKSMSSAEDDDAQLLQREPVS